MFNNVIELTTLPPPTPGVVWCVAAQQLLQAVLYVNEHVNDFKGD